MPNPFASIPPMPREYNTKYKGLREAIVYNETKLGTAEYKTAEQLAKEFGATRAYVYRLRYLLGFKIPNLKPKPQEDLSLKSAITDTGALQDLLNEPLISPLDRLKVLSRLVRTGAPAVKIAAIKAYEELTRTSENRIGPGPPLTRDDKVARLAKLFLALPQDVAAEAWEIAYGLPATTAPNRSSLQPDSEPVPRVIEEVESTVPDLPIPSNRGPSTSD